MTLLAVVAGPAGVVLGFALSMRAEHLKALREAKEKQREQALSRALGLLAAADTVEGEGRGLAHAAYLQATGHRPVMDQVQAAIERLNSAMATMSRFILEADVLGPEGLGDIGRILEARARDLLAVVNDMNQRPTSGDLRKVQDETLPALVTAIETAIVQVRRLLEVSPQPAARNLT